MNALNILLRISFPALLALAASAPVAAKTETREATGFTALSLAAPIRVDLVLGEVESVVLEGDENLLAKIETTVVNGSLRIRKRPGHDWGSKWSRNDVRARVTARRIEAIAIAGSGDVVAPQLSGKSLAVSIAGSGDVTISGGKVTSLSVDIAGSGDVKASKLDAGSVAISIAGSGDATVWARQSLSVQVVGSGDVKYYGDPVLARSVVGSGEVRRLGAAPT